MGSQELAKNAFDPSMWTKRAEGGYGRLGWVNAQGPLQKMVELAALKGNETIVDVGTGNQKILKELTSNLNGGGKGFGFDISPDMLKAGEGGKYSLFVADTYAIPLPDESADLVTARMIYHHLENPEAAINESRRVLTPSGKFIVCEYVAVDGEVWQFERGVFDIKEPSRNLWTGEQLAGLIQENWNTGTVGLDYAVMPQYSVRDWMANSGLSPSIQQQILDKYLQAPSAVVEKMGITITEDKDALVDRPFAFVVAQK